MLFYIINPPAATLTAEERYKRATDDDCHILTITRLKENSLRDYTPRELHFDDQNYVENRLYKKFAVNSVQRTSGGGTGIAVFNDNITDDSCHIHTKPIDNRPIAIICHRTDCSLHTIFRFLDSSSFGEIILP